MVQHKYLLLYALQGCDSTHEQRCLHPNKWNWGHSSHVVLIYSYVWKYIRRRGVVGRVPAFQPGASARSGQDFNFCPWIRCVCVCPLSVFCPVFSLAEALILRHPIRDNDNLCVTFEMILVEQS